MSPQEKKVFTQDNQNPLAFDTRCLPPCEVHKSLIKTCGVLIKGWTAKLHPASHPAATFQFDVFISAGGGRFVPDGETNVCALRSPLIAKRKEAAAILQGRDVDTKRR